MSTHLTAGQKALLEAALTQRQHQLDNRLADLTQGLSRAEHAHEVLLRNDDDAPQRAEIPAAPHRTGLTVHVPRVVDGAASIEGG